MAAAREPSLSCVLGIFPRDALGAGRPLSSVAGVVEHGILRRPDETASSNWRSPRSKSAEDLACFAHLRARPSSDDPPEVRRTEEDGWCAEALRDPVGVRRLHDDVLEDVAEVAGPCKVADLLHKADGGEEESSPFPVVSFSRQNDGEVRHGGAAAQMTMANAAR